LFSEEKTTLECAAIKIHAHKALEEEGTLQLLWNCQMDLILAPVVIELLLIATIQRMEREESPISMMLMYVTLSCSIVSMFYIPACS
jgi:hypothetical protein